MLRQFFPNNGEEHLMEHPKPVKPGLHSAKTVPELLAHYYFQELIMFS